MKRKFAFFVTALTLIVTFAFAQTSDTIYGYVTYQKSSTALDSVTVNLKNSSGVIIATTMTDANGYYQFANIGNGTYTLQLSTSLQPGGVTISDAIQVLLHKLMPAYFPFTAMQKLAADINDNNVIGWDDFYAILGIIAGQNPGGWSFENISIQVNGNKAVIKRDVGGTADGDPDGSFDPAGKPGRFIQLIEKGNMTASANEDIEIPVKLNQNYPIGGLGLIFNYPADLIEITGIESNSKNMDFYISNGEVRIIWIDETLGNSMRITSDNALFTIKARTTDKFDMSSTIHFSLGQNSDIMGEKGKRITALAVILPVIDWTTGVEEYLTNYPNPCAEYTDIEYSVPSEGNVTLCLYNITGEKVKTIVNEYHKPGYYNKNIDVTDLETGIYLYQLNIEGSQNMTLSRRMIITR